LAGILPPPKVYQKFTAKKLYKNFTKSLPKVYRGKKADEKLLKNFRLV
jgi:hypothetical protein